MSIGSSCSAISVSARTDVSVGSKTDRRLEERSNTISSLNTCSEMSDAL